VRARSGLRALSPGVHCVVEVARLVLKKRAITVLSPDRPTHFDFALNLKTAKDLNLTIPRTLLGFADTVIE